MPNSSRPRRRRGRDVLSDGARQARPWAAAWFGGVCGTAAMTLALEAETRLRPNAEGPIDYDASDHVAIAACKVLRRPLPRSEAGRKRISEIAHWGYGSVVAVGFEGLRRGTGSDAAASALFYAGCQATALVLFPTLGETPPPWRWKRELLASSLAVHAVYAGTVALVARAAR